MKIQDLFFQALLDDSQLQIDATKSGQAAGEKLGKSMSQRLSSALKTTAFTALAGASAIAGKGLIELQGITADFTAATGASAEEAERAGKAINAMGGRNLQPLREIGDTLTVVHTDLGLTGEAAEKTTEKFLKYGTATKQGPAAAVKDFDDILDAWNLTADHSGEVMDALIASHQKYGGSIEENQKALAAMAPQLIALNADWRDGVGLLNLFAASGIDAATTTRALNTAVKNLKPGQNLDDLVREISSIEDPTKRAQRAIEIFGSRGGTALANALKPGITSLDTFEISATDAAGATEKASDAIEGTFGNQVVLKIKAVGSAIIGVGQTIGPLGSALTGLISLGGALGLDKAIAGAWKKVGTSGLVTSAATKAGAVIGAVYATATEVTEHVVEIVKEAWHELSNKIGVKLAATKAGVIVGGVYGQAVAVGTKLAEALAAVWAKLPFMGALRGAVLTAGLAAGGAYGTAIAEALAAAPIVVPLLLIPDIQEHLPDFSQGVQAQMKKRMDDIANGRVVAIDAPKAGAAVGAALAEGAGVAVATQLGPAIRDGFDTAGPQVVASAKDVSKVVSSSIGNMGANWAKVAKEQGRRAGRAVADGIRSTREDMDAGWQTFLDALTSVETPAKRSARLLGRLASKELAGGLNDERPEVKLEAEAVFQDTIDELGQIVASGGKIGKNGMEALRRAMHSKNPEIAAAARAIYKAAHDPIAKLPPTGTTIGRNTGQNLADGLDAKIGAVAAAAFRLGQAALQAFGDASFGANHRATGGPVEAGQAYTVGENGPEQFVPRVPGTIIPNMRWPGPAHVASAAAPSNTTYAGDTYNVNLLDRLPVRSVRDIGSDLRMLGEQGKLARKARPA